MNVGRNCTDDTDDTDDADDWNKSGSITYPSILLATEECLDIDFGDISNSESDLERVVHYRDG